MSNTISVKHISKSYGDFTAVQDLSLEVHAGSIFGLLGPNGAGKSTSIRMIVNITIPDSGEIRLFGEPMNEKLQERVGYLPEDRGLYKKMKIGEQLLFFAELKGLKHAAAKRRVDEWMERVGLSEWKAKRWEELSKGMQQKVQFVSTILHDPDLVILDEPFTGLDPINANLLKEIVQEMRQRNKTIIFSTHLMEQAEELCDEICLINRGRKVLSGPLREVKRSFGWRSLAVDGENLDGLLTDNPLVKAVTPQRHHLEVALHDGADPQALLKDLVNANARLTRFELVAPTLNEIFIESVGRANEQAGAAA
ncbi:MAG: ATP-binding cassette domain-containing protein [Acidobacteria bacterium]|nr:ATP-binding cassette domain-containing protein [Acidobacteriota bacterium]MBI3427839.1 ATP-binding cassette domain-containing protein [Acidobacteriota bacterium]